jgi:hypothetical protein
VPGYDVNQLLLVFDDDSALLMWSGLVRYGVEPWHESFVLHAEVNLPSTDAIGLTNPGASAGFTRAQPIDQVFAGNELAKPELFVDLGETYIANEQDYLTSDSLRIQVGAERIELLTEGRSVRPLSLVLRSTAFPVCNTRAAGERNWLSSQQHGHLSPKRRPDGDA